MIAIADVRDDMLDRTAADHLVLTDLAFTDADIEWAMKAAARNFNSITPLVAYAVWDALPDDTNIFFDGIAAALYRRWKGNVAVNDMDYSAGGLNASVQGNLMKNLDRVEKEADERFRTAAKDLKIVMNIRSAFGQIG